MNNKKQQLSEFMYTQRKLNYELTTNVAKFDLALWVKQHSIQLSTIALFANTNFLVELSNTKREGIRTVQSVN